MITVNESASKVELGVAAQARPSGCRQAGSKQSSDLLGELRRLIRSVHSA